MQQGYGLTELSPGAMLSPPFFKEYGSVGFPLPDTEVKVCMYTNFYY